MPEICQADIFAFLCNDRLLWKPSQYKQSTIADVLVKKMGQQIPKYNKKISAIIHGDRGFPGLNPDKFYECFFQPMVDTMTPYELAAHFQALKHAVEYGRKGRKGPLEFDGWKGPEVKDLKGEDLKNAYHDYVIRMLGEALPRCAKLSKDEQQASGADKPFLLASPTDSTAPFPPLKDDDFSHLKVTISGRERLLGEIQKYLDKDDKDKWVLLKCLDKAKWVLLSGIGDIVISARATEGIVISKAFAARNKMLYSSKQIDSSKEAKAKLKEEKERICRLRSGVEMNDERKSLLRRLTFLPDEGISSTLLLNMIDGLYRSCANKLLDYLVSHSWVIRENDQIRIHPVIRDTVREDSPPECWEWSVHREFLKKIREAMEAEDDNKNQISLCLLARNLCEELHKRREVPLGLWDDLREIARRCKAVYQYEPALSLYEFLSDIEAGAKPEERVDLFLEMGSIYQHWAEYPKAITHYQTALNMAQRDDDWRGSCYKSLGVACRKDGNYETAKAYFIDALKCYKRKDLIVPVLRKELDILTAPDGSGVITALDDLDREVITAQDDLGHVYRHLGEAATERGETEIAEEYYQKAKEIAEAVLELRDKCGEDAKELAVSHHRIGSACYCLGDYKRALDEHERAEALRPGIAASYHWIGKDYLQLGELDKAETNLEDSLRLRKEHLLEDHPDIAKSLISLSEYYEKTGDLLKVQEYAQEAYKIRVKRLRPGHPYILSRRLILKGVVFPKMSCPEMPKLQGFILIPL